MSTIQGPLPTPPATRLRYGVLALGCTLAMIVYLDRTCLASAASSIIGELHLRGEADFGLVCGAFALAYALFEIPNGWLGDRFGPRAVLLRIVIWWSIFVALTGAVGLSIGGCVLGGFYTLVVVQFLAGMGEAGAFPNITRALHNWFPYDERGRAQGAVWMCGRLMGGLTPLLWTILVAGIGYHVTLPDGHAVLHKILPPLLHWRSVFWVFGLLGVAWCVWFGLWFRNRPEEKRGVNAAELARIRTGRVEARSGHAAVPWRSMLASRNLWLLCLMYFCQSYAWYFYITYLPKFFEKSLNVPLASLRGALYKGGPLWMGAVACLAGGFLSDAVIRRTGSLRWGRRIPGLLSHSLTALCFTACSVLCSVKHDPFWFFLAISAAGFSTDLAMGSAWATCQDIGRRYSAVVAGSMNMIGNLGGALASWVFGLVLDHSLAGHALRLGAKVEVLTQAQKADGLWSGYQVNFMIAAGMYVVGVLCWLRIDATRPVVAN
ncbi:MAG: MFS transporter [Thermoguttaceae bacterium]|jgi:MFS family permease